MTDGMQESDKASSGSIEHRSVEAEQELVCSGIWGGIRNLDRTVRAGPLVASLYTSSCDGGKGGDIVFFGVCRGDTLTRVAIADVMGHGQAVSDVSQYMYDSLKAHMCDPDSSAILRQVNQLAGRRGLKAMTTAAVVAYDAVAGEFAVSNAGHPPVLFKRANQETWSIVASADDGNGDDGSANGLPLAVAADTVYEQLLIPATSGDRLFVYTDGVTETPNAAMELFGIERLNGVLDANADASLPQLKSEVLQALDRHSDKRLTHDDVTLIALEVR